jgi:predicted RNA-binding Zn-ribbon protein involved in translation (DUF1610 family)
MSPCPNCGLHMTRVHRSAMQKVLYRDVLACSRCRFRTKRLRIGVDVALTFYFSRFTHCIRCGSPRIERLSKRDVVDSMSRHPVSGVLRLTGAPIRRCPACRLQYCDWRPPVPDRR